MNIRLNKPSEVKKLVEIWRKGSISAHNFIDKNYWISQQVEMEDKYIPMSETYVISNEGDIVGFLSMMDNYLAALFIDGKHQGQGYGKGLLDFIKSQRKTVCLKVYKRNIKAIDFYIKNGFVIKEELVDVQTSEEEFLMEWNKG